MKSRSIITMACMNDRGQRQRALGLTLIALLILLFVVLRRFWSGA